MEYFIRMKKSVYLNTCKIVTLFSLAFISMFFFIEIVSANNYTTDVYFTVPDSVYTTNEKIVLKGFVYQNNSNGSISTYGTLANATVNFSIMYNNRTLVNNYTFTTDSNGAFYSSSNFYPGAINVSAPPINGNYILRAGYIDPNSNTSFSEFGVSVLNASIDIIKIKPEKAVYKPSETINVDIEAIKIVGDKLIYVANVSVNGSMMNSSKSQIQTFNCTTGANGKCTIGLSASSIYGSYILEVGNFKTFSSFFVVPFSYIVYMQDDLNSLKNVFALSETARVEVKINNASSSDSYSFSGYITDSAGNSVKSIDSTTLSNSNSFTNSFLFIIDPVTFNYDSYSVYLTITKSGDGSISSTTSFKVQDWIVSVDKKTSDSGFEYEFSTFPNKTLKFEALPTYRTNGSVIQNISNSSFTVNLKDSLSNNVASANVSWNASCGKSGCYEYSLTSPINAGKYSLLTTLSYSGDSQTDSRTINVISGVMSAQSTDKDGNIKELFGTNEYAYLSLSAYNLTSSIFNLSDAEIFLVNYMNGSEFSYIQVNNFSSVNSSNSAYEWAWNSTLQRIKLDVPKSGGIYNIFVFGNNRTLGTETKFIVNPYDSCISAKNTPGSVTSGYYYVWQFKTSDTIYFEIKLTQANNPLGKASAVNGTNSSSYGKGSACSVDTTTKQVVNNATISVIEVKNLQSGALQTINSSESSCQASDTSGGYTCTVKPSLKWDGGVNIVKLNVQGQDGSSSILYSNFETRAFYLYGYSSNWQNSPDSNINLNLQLYEAGSNWWGSSSGGVSGTITVKKVEYQGRDGEWIWPPVNSGYNLTNVSSVSITSGTGSVNLPASLAPGGVWKTGYYRVVLQATKTSTGETDYGYAWFAVKLWDVYGSPVECTSAGCNYKSYFNSKENITLFIKISKASGYNYNYAGGENIYGNVSVGIKKIEECKTYPCKELNSSQYVANTINVNASSPWYWNANNVNQSKYMIQINRTSGSWSTGWYNVVLNVNTTDTGYAWFNAIAFYVEIQPTNSSGGGYVYSIRGSQPMYFNVTTTKSYKWNSYGGARYNLSDYINTTVQSAVLRTWDSQTYKSKELTYPTDFNISSNITGNSLINISYNKGSWPTGYYWGELILKNPDNDTSTGWLWFNVQPFRVSISSNTYNIDSDQCINSTLTIYEADWSSTTPLAGNYSVTGIYEDIWGGSYTRTTYTNYTSGSFNATSNVTFCPNGTWSSGNWGGYHSLNVVVNDNSDNITQTGWLSFRTVPFQVTWNPSSIGSKRTNANINTTANLTKSTGAAALGNLSKVYQWRYDNYQSTKEEYRFVVNTSGYNCDSAVFGQCTVNQTANITIYAPSGGWKIGYNYLQAQWNKQDDATAVIEDWSGIYFDGREAFNGYFSNVDSNGNYKYNFVPNENITIKITVQDDSYGSVLGTISSVSYALSPNCWSESCRSNLYTSATFSPTAVNSSGSAILQIAVPSTNWNKGYYAIKAVVNGTTITGGSVRVKDLTPPNVTLNVPQNNGTYNISLGFSATTSEASTCNINLVNYDIFYNWYCGGWNSTNTTAPSAQTLGACNITKYSYSGPTNRQEYLSNTYHSYYYDYNYSYCYISSGSSYCYGPDSSRTTTYISTGGTSHTYTLNITSQPAQHYGIQIGCYDEDYNYVNSLAAFKINNSI